MLSIISLIFLDFHGLHLLTYRRHSLTYQLHPLSYGRHPVTNQPNILNCIIVARKMFLAEQQMPPETTLAIFKNIN
jgi:hypothetical protein